MCVFDYVSASVRVWVRAWLYAYVSASSIRAYVHEIPLASLRVDNLLNILTFRPRRVRRVEYDEKRRMGCGRLAALANVIRKKMA